MYRRTLQAIAVIACASLLFAPVWSNAATAESMAIQVYPGIFLSLLPWVAQTKGFYVKRGLDVKLVPLNSGGQGLAALQGDSIQLAQNNADVMMLAVAQGVDLQMAAGNWGQQFTLIARNGLLLPHAQEGYPAVLQDLVGKNIGVNARGSGNEFAMRVTLSEAGLDPDSVHYVGVGGTTGVVNALRNGVVDAIAAPIEGAYVLRAMDLGTIIIDYQRGQGPKSFQALSPCYAGFFGKRSWISQHGDELRKFNDANKEAEAWARDPKNREELISIMLNQSPLSGVSNQRAVAGEFLATAPFQTAMDAACLEGWNRLLLESKLLHKPLDVKTLVWSGLSQ